jgi:hypothetical protein
MGPSTSPNSNPYRPGGGASGGQAAGGPNPFRSRPNRKKRNRPGPQKPQKPQPPGATEDPLNTTTGQMAYEDLDNWQDAGMGTLANLGIGAAGGPDKQLDWLTNTFLPKQHSDFVGNQLNDNNDLTWLGHLQGALGGNPTAATAPPADAGPLGFVDWRSQQAGVGPKAWNAAKKKKKKKLKGRYGNYAANYAAPEVPPGGGVAGINPATARGIVTQAWQSASPLARGYDSTRWRAPKRTIEFALLLASIGVIVGAVFEALA